jgi:hypothetical protein
MEKLGMKEELIERLKKLYKKIPDNKEWHEISQKEANEIKNYNKGITDALEIIQNIL